MTKAYTLHEERCILAQEAHSTPPRDREMVCGTIG